MMSGFHDNPPLLLSMAPPLSSDIIDYLLTSLPDFATLLSTILVSKSFHEAFQAHPGSILTSVATNHISPELLPCAIRLAHFNRDEYLASRTDYVQNFPLERSFSHNEALTVTPHLLALIKNDSVVTELELFFSIACVLFFIHPREYVNGCVGKRFKDRTTGTRSLLNPRESLRFRRALYRWWLLNSLFPPFYLRPTRTGETANDEGVDAEGDDSDDEDDEGSDTEDDDDDDDDSDTEDDDDDSDTEDDDDDGDRDAPNAYHAKAQDLRKVFLSEFSDDEVAEMWQVFNSMELAASCARGALSSSNYPVHPCMSSYFVHPMLYQFKLFQSSCYGTGPPPLPGSSESSGPSRNRTLLGRNKATGTTTILTVIGQGSPVT